MFEHDGRLKLAIAVSISKRVKLLDQFVERLGVRLFADFRPYGLPRPKLYISDVATTYS